MTLRRSAVLAQATALLMLLLSGLHPGGPASSLAAIDPHVDVSVGLRHVSDAADRGVGCTSRSRYKGPRVPGDPPPLPGSERTPAPETTAETGASGLDAGGTDEDTASGPTMLLAASVRTAQAEPTPAPDENAEFRDDGETAPADPGREPRTKPNTRAQARAAGLTAGIDVSHWQGLLDWGQIKKKKREFAFIKATESTTFLDPLYDSHLASAIEAGVAVGAYHVFDYTIDGKRQADHFVDRLEQVGGLDGALPPVVDVECFTYMGRSTHVAAEARLRDFVKRVYERTARLPIIYTSVFMWDQVVGGSERFSRSPLWAACWGCDLPPSIAPGWDDWTFWQTGVDRVPGVGRLDGNFFSGSRQDLRRLRLRPLRVEGGRPATGDSEVEISLGGRDAVQVRSSLDGEAWSEWRPVRGRPSVELAEREGEQTVFVQLRAGPGLRSAVFSDSIALDLTGPSVSEPAVTLRDGPVSSDAVPIAVSWVASDAVAGLSDGVVEVSCGTGAPIPTEASASAAPGEAAAMIGEAAVGVGGSCDVAAIGHDGVGNTTRVAGPTVSATIIADVPSDAVVYAGDWQREQDDAALGGSRRVSSSPGATVNAAISGRHIGIIAGSGPAGGRAEVLLDGEMIGLIDTYAPEATGPQVVFTAQLVVPGPEQRLTVRPLGSADTASTGTAIAIDGFVVLS